MPELETRELKLTGHMTHVFAGSGEQIHAALRQLSGLGLREVAAIADDDAVLHPPGERIKELTIIDRSRGQIKAAEAPLFITLHVQFKPVPPAHPVLGFTRGGQLSKADKLGNRALASQRIVCEHVIGKLKVFKILAERYRNRRRRFGLRVHLLAALYNLNLPCPR